MLQVSPTTGPVRRGECYVRVTLLMAGFAVGRLIAGYVTDGATLAWPGGKFENFTDGAGLIRSITGTNPAAGVEILEAVPTNTRWRLKSLVAALIADATVTTRRVHLVFDDGVDETLKLPVGIDQTANVGIVYHWGIGIPQASAAAGVILTCQLPMDFTLFQGFRIKTAVTNFQAGDNWSAPLFQVEEWIEE